MTKQQCRLLAGLHVSVYTEHMHGAALICQGGVRFSILSPKRGTCFCFVLGITPLRT
jgi:hypothetical protein